MARRVFTEENDIEERARSIRLEELPERIFWIEEPRMYYVHEYEWEWRPGGGEWRVKSKLVRDWGSRYPPFPVEGLTVDKSSPEEE